VCTFKCDESYSLVGSSRNITCNPDENEPTGGGWSDASPMCQGITCPALNNPENGEISCDDSNKYGSVCSFTCNDGFVLLGMQNLTCEGNENNSINGTWNGDTPFCEGIVCPTLPPPTNGEIDCSDGDKYNSTCVFVCDGGYALVGEDKLTCISNEEGQQSGLWDETPPECKQITCPVLPPPDNGDLVCTDDVNFGSECVFSCDEGFALLGEETLTCGTGEGINGVWNVEEPVCQEIKCPVLSPPDQGDIFCSASNNFDSQCTIQCDNGYGIEGNSILTCGEGQNGTIEGNWDQPLPACATITCPSLTSPENGDISCSENNYVYGNLCFFECDEGFELNGAPPLRCGGDGSNSVGEWTDSVPTCQAALEGFSSSSDIISLVFICTTVLLALILIATCYYKRKNKPDSYHRADDKDTSNKTRL